jgi:cobalt-zinc-cadmium efflux system protein
VNSGHSHGVPGPGQRRALTVVLGICAAILAAEVAGALLSGSLALLADAGHMLSDAAGLALALTATVLAARPATDTRTWGYLRAEVLAAAAQAAVLLAVGGFVLAEAIRRLITPPAVTPGIMVAFGVIALAGNAISVLVLTRLQGGNLNTRAAMLEVANDALGAAAVIVAAGVIAVTGWSRADPVASLVIAVLIVPRTIKLLREALRVLMEATPKDVDLAEVRAHILAVEHVQGVHDLHATSVASTLPVLTAHVVVDDSCFEDRHLPKLLDQLQQCLAGHFDVEHSTFQFEPGGHAGHEHATHP